MSSEEEEQARPKPRPQAQPMPPREPEALPPRLRQATPSLGRPMPPRGVEAPMPQAMTPPMSGAMPMQEASPRPEAMPRRAPRLDSQLIDETISQRGMPESKQERGRLEKLEVEQSNPPMMPRVLRHRLDYLEKWALQNKEEARTDMIRFWRFKIPTILGAAAAPLIAYFSTSAGWALIGIIIGGLAAAFALIDGIYPSGILRNVHYRAYHELRELQQVTEIRWETYYQGPQSENLVQELLETILKKVEEIAKYIKEAEISLKH